MDGVIVSDSIGIAVGDMDGTSVCKSILIKIIDKFHVYNVIVFDFHICYYAN